MKNVVKDSEKTSKEIVKTTKTAVSDVDKGMAGIKDSADDVTKAVKKWADSSAEATKESANDSAKTVKASESEIIKTISDREQKVKDVSAAIKESMSKMSDEIVEKEKKSAEQYKKDVMSLAHEYKKQGMSMSEAMKKAYAEIDKTAYKSAKEQQEASEETKDEVVKDEQEKAAEIIKISKNIEENSKKAADNITKNNENESKKTAKHWENAGKRIQAALKLAAKVGTAAISGAAGLIGKILKDSVAGYGEYEQLVGGINKLYGEGAAQLQKYAENAYSTAGMSANDYMQNVTGFSASLINSLGGNTKKAADLADQAMRDISDNANTFGKYTSQELAQVYQALAKGNYQTLDNLMLGFGGTKDGAEQLIKKAEQLNKTFKANRDENGKLTMSFSDMVEAIHIVQEDMNITGTTAKEASGTIQGAAGSMKAAWQNLVSGLAQPTADIGRLIDQFVLSVESTLDNIYPAIERALSGIGTLVEKTAPIISSKLPELVSSILPSMIKAATELIIGVAQAMPQLVSPILKSVQTILTLVVAKLKEAFPALNPVFESIGNLVQSLSRFFASLFDTLSTNEKTTQKTQRSFSNIADVLSGLINTVAKLFDWLSKNQDVTLALVAAFMSLKAALTAYNVTVEVITAVTTVATTIMDAYRNSATLAEFAQKALNITMEANPIGFVIAALAALVTAFTTLWNTSEKFRNFWIQLGDTLRNVAIAAGKGIADFWTKTVPEWVGQVINAVEQIPRWFENLPYEIGYALGSAVGEFYNFLNMLVEAVPRIASEVIAAIVGFFSSLPEKIGNALYNVFVTFGGFVTDLKTEIETAIPKLIDSLVGFFSALPEKFADIGKNIIDGLWNGLSSAWNGFISGAESLFNGFVDGLRDQLGIHSPSRVFAEMGRFSALGYGNGFEKQFDTIKSDIENDMEFTTDDHSNASRKKNVFGGSQPIQVVLNIESFINRTDDDLEAIVDTAMQIVSEKVNRREQVYA